MKQFIGFFVLCAIVLLIIFFANKSKKEEIIQNEEIINTELTQIEENMNEENTNQNNTNKEITFENGLKKTILSEGSGEVSKKGDTVKVHYVGTFTDGTKFDSSRDRGTPFEFTLGEGRVIRGWDEGLVGMIVGEKAIFTIPSDLAYGPNGIPGAIPGGATLIFEVEMIEIK